MPSDVEISRLHLGGLGTNARMIWDRIPPSVDAFDAENQLVFGTGLLAGTPAPGTYILKKSNPSHISSSRN